MSLSNSLTPTGDLGAWRVMEPSPVDFASVENIVSNASIAEAWKKVRSNKGAPGVDGINIEKFPKRVRPQWNEIKRQLLDGTYVLSPALRVEIPKESGGVRRLGIPGVLDRVLMQAIAMVLREIFNPTFSANSFGYKPHRSVQLAARRAQSFYQQGYTLQIDIDLEKFFDNLDHELVMKGVSKQVKINWALLYIKRWLKVPMQSGDGSLIEREKGTPQGGVISSLLANLFMHYAFDEWMRRNHPSIPFERYADDAVLHCKSEKPANFIKDEVNNFKNLVFDYLSESLEFFAQIRGLRFVDYTALRCRSPMSRSKTLSLTSSEALVCPIILAAALMPWLRLGGRYLRLWQSDARNLTLSCFNRF